MNHTHNFTLFLNKSNDKISHMRFYIYDCKEKKELKKLIHDRCGIVDSFPTNRTISLSRFHIKSAKWEVFSINFIFHCCKKNKLLDLKLYRFSKVLNNAEFDPMDVLTGIKEWPVKFREENGCKTQECNQTEPSAPEANFTQSSKKIGHKYSENQKFHNYTQFEASLKASSTPRTPENILVDNDKVISAEKIESSDLFHCRPQLPESSSTGSVNSKNCITPKFVAMNKRKGNYFSAHSKAEVEGKNVSSIETKSLKSQMNNSNQKCMKRCNPKLYDSNISKVNKSNHNISSVYDSIQEKVRKKQCKCHSTNISETRHVHSTTGQSEKEFHPKTCCDRLSAKVPGCFSTAQNNCKSKLSTHSKYKTNRSRHFVCSAACEHNLSGMMEDTSFSSQTNCDKFKSGCEKSFESTQILNYSHDFISSSDSSFDEFSKRIPEHSVKYGNDMQNIIEESATKSERKLLLPQFDLDHESDTSLDSSFWMNSDDEIIESPCSTTNNNCVSVCKEKCKKFLDERHSSTCTFSQNESLIQIYKTDTNLNTTSWMNNEEGVIEQPSSNVKDNYVSLYGEKCKNCLDNHHSVNSTFKQKKSLTKILNDDIVPVSLKTSNQSSNTKKSVNCDLSPTDVYLPVVSTRPENCNNLGEETDISNEFISVGNNTFNFSNEVLPLIKSHFSQHTKRDFNPHHVKSSIIQDILLRAYQKFHLPNFTYDILCAAILCQPVLGAIREGLHNNQNKTILASNDINKSRQIFINETDKPELMKQSNDTVNLKKNPDVIIKRNDNNNNQNNAILPSNYKNKSRQIIINATGNPELMKQSNDTVNFKKFPEVNCFLKSTDAQENSASVLSYPIINNMPEKNKLYRVTCKSVSQFSEVPIYDDDDEALYTDDSCDSKCTTPTRKSTKFSENNDREDVALPIDELQENHYPFNKAIPPLSNVSHNNQNKTSDGSSVSIHNDSVEAKLNGESVSRFSEIPIYDDNDKALYTDNSCDSKYTTPTRKSTKFPENNDREDVALPIDELQENHYPFSKVIPPLSNVSHNNQNKTSDGSSVSIHDDSVEAKLNSESVSRFSEIPIYDDNDKALYTDNICDSKYTTPTRKSTKFSDNNDREDVALAIDELQENHYLFSKEIPPQSNVPHNSQYKTSDASSVSIHDGSVEVKLKGTLKETTSDFESLKTLSKIVNNNNDSFASHTKETDGLQEHPTHDNLTDSILSVGNMIKWNGRENKNSCERKEISDLLLTQDCCHLNNEDNCSRFVDGSDVITNINGTHYPTCTSSQESYYFPGLSPDMDLVIPYKQ